MRKEFEVCFSKFGPSEVWCLDVLMFGVSEVWCGGCLHVWSFGMSWKCGVWMFGCLDFRQPLANTLDQGWVGG